MGRRSAAWLIDAALGALLAACFVKAAGGQSDLRDLSHLWLFKSVNGRAGHQLSDALNPTGASFAALRPVLGLLAILTVIAVAMVAYRVVTTALWGGGIGKLLLDLRIVVDRPDGPLTELPGWARSWKRWGVPQLPGLIPLPATGLLAYLPAFRDVRRRGLHDRVAGTVVVDTRRVRSTVPERRRHDVLDRDRRLLEDQIGA